MIASVVFVYPMLLLVHYFLEFFTLIIMMIYSCTKFVILGENGTVTSVDKIWLEGSLYSV